MNSLHGVDVMAQSLTGGGDSILIAITNPELEVDDLKRAAAQAGYGWLLMELSRDATQICVSQIVSDGMTQEEKIGAAYSYITENVSYDFRYYNDRENMPYESTTAIGALRDGLAICGGYAHAFETLLDMLGVENYTVSGVSGGEYHMWNLVMLDGTGYYCDPTADRGGMDRHFLLTGDELEEHGGYDWDRDFYSRLSAG